MGDNTAITALAEVTDAELDAIMGGDGAINTVSHECHMNSWQFVFTCCA